MAKTQDQSWKSAATTFVLSLLGALVAAGCLWMFGLAPTLATIQSDVGYLKRDFTELKGGVKELNGRVDDINGELIRVSTKVEGMALADRVRQVIVQQGQFTAGNRVPDSDPPAFKWELVVPIEPATGAEIQVVPDAPLPGVAITAELADDGRSCVMTLHGRR